MTYRLRFDGIEVHPEEDLCRVEVRFAFSGEAFEVSATDRNDWAGQLRAASSATLKAIERIAAGRMSCALEDLDRVNALGKNLIAVLVNVELGDQKFQLFGSCQITSSEIESAVKATLNATNRIIELALRK
jgi:hypothetical protein